jgi:hypothetical protein
MRNSESSGEQTAAWAWNRELVGEREWRGRIRRKERKVEELLCT